MNASWTVIGSSAYGWLTGHQGLMIDSESGLTYNRVRPNDGTLGAFVSRDPAQYVDGPSLYLVERANPVRFVDPTGLDIFLYFWDTTQSPSGAGHTAIGVGSQCQQFFYEAYPSKGDNSPMGQPFAQSGSMDTVIGAASERSSPRVTLQFSTSSKQDALALQAIAKWFHANPNWSAEGKTDCADLDQAALGAAGLPTYPLGPLVSTPEQLSRFIHRNPQSGAQLVQGNWTAYNWQSGIFGVFSHLVVHGVSAGVSGVGNLLSGIGGLVFGKCACRRTCKPGRR
jgi:RHS repeat-associated protein